jgi:hypothetical protein
MLRVARQGVEFGKANQSRCRRTGVVRRVHFQRRNAAVSQPLPVDIVGLVSGLGVSVGAGFQGANG